MGRWEGTWTSQSDSNSGLLRCIITKTAPGKYNAEFHATYWGLLTFTMPVALEGAFRDDKWQFKGQKDLGVLAGGVYTYEGWADEDTFYSTYDSSYERGVFEMKRVDQFSQPLTQPTTEPQGGT